MSGHSKWKNIMHKKEKSDAQRANIFTKIGKEMAVAVREGGPNPASNGKLRELIAKAKSNNVPNDNIDRVIKKFSTDNSINYEEITYEGYGPCGVAVIVKTTTDNRNRTAGDVRHFFDKYGGNLGQNGCVSFLFEDVGTIIINKDDGINDDTLMEAALEAGASDFAADDDFYEITTEPSDLESIRDTLEKAGYKIETAELDKQPSNYVKLDNEDDIKHMRLLLDNLEDNDDVTDVFHNWEE